MFHFGDYHFHDWFKNPVVTITITGHRLRYYTYYIRHYGPSITRSTVVEVERSKILKKDARKETGGRRRRKKKGEKNSV